jgi:LytS/YehU family sensor histidine kinase
MQQKHKQILRFLWINTVAAVIVPVLGWALSPHVTLRSLLVTFGFSFMHAQVIGGLATYTAPKVERLLTPLHPVLHWLLFMISLVAVGAIGCILAAVVILALHLIPFAVYRGEFFIILKICVVVTLQIGIVAKIYGGMRARLDHTALQLRSKELERERALKLATEARLASLTSRVHPHFLFNTLNSISSLIQEDPARADRLVERMAALLRFSLDSGQSGLVPLADEVKIVTDYLEIEKARFGERLSYRLDVPDELLQIELPPLSVQTLVENSVKYAISPVRAGGEIQITASRNGDDVLLAVSDTGPGFDINKIPAGHGLENLQSRLAVVFGEKSRLTSTSHDGRSAVVINIPQAKGKA